MWLHALAMLAVVLVPSGARAEPEVLLMLGGSPTWNTSQPSGDPLGLDPDTVTFPVHEGDVRRVPACDSVGTTLSPVEDSPRHRTTVVRFLKRRLPDGTCEIEVLKVRPRPSGEAEAPGSAEALGDAAGARGAWSSIDPTSIPCGSELVETRGAGAHNSISSVHGVGPTGECADDGVASGGPRPPAALPTVAPGPERDPAAWRPGAVRITRPDGTTTVQEAAPGTVFRLDRDAEGRCPMNFGITSGTVVEHDPEACTLTVREVDAADAWRGSR